MACETSNYRIEPQEIHFGVNTYQVECVTCVADVAGSLNNKYFIAYTPAGAKHYFWYNVNSAGTDPAIGGATAHAIAVATSASAGTVAAATQAVIEAMSEFASSVSGADVSFTHAAYGYAYASHDGYTSSKTNFSFKLITAGSASENLGATDGDIAISIEETMSDITTHQAGSIPVDSIITGRTITATATLKEVTKAKIHRIMQLAGGDTLLPNGASATALSGFGTGSLFRSVYVTASKLRLHPVKKGSADYSEDIVMPKAKVKFGEMTFSGENVLMLPIEIVSYPDSSASFDVLDMMTFGDHSQSL